MCFSTCFYYLTDYRILLLVSFLGLVGCLRYYRGSERCRRVIAWCSRLWGYDDLDVLDVQLYCKRSDELATNVCQDLKARLFSKRYNLHDKQVYNLDPEKPTIVVCFKTSRPLADVSDATREISHLLNNKMALIIFQLTTEDPLTDGCSELVRGYSDYASLGLLVDLGFRNNQGRYVLNNNSYAVNLIANFFRNLMSTL